MVEFLEVLIIGLAILTPVVYCICLQKDLKHCKLNRTKLTENILHMDSVMICNLKQYEKLQDGIQNELNKLKGQVNQFKLERDPDAEFPSMERSIQEANVVSNFRMLQRLYKDLT